MIALVKRFGPVIVMGALLIGFVFSGAWRLFSFHQLQAHHAELKAFVAKSPILSLAAFCAVFVAVILACTPGPGALCVAGGYLFGAIGGGLASLAAAVVGSTAVFLACRSAFSDLLEQRGGRRAHEIEAELRRNAFSYLLTLKLIPVVPFFVPNIAAGLAGVRLSAVVAASALGSAPVCFILASLGAGLGRMMDHGATPSRHMLEQPSIWLPLAGLSALAAATVAWRAFRARSLPAPPP